MPNHLARAAALVVLATLVACGGADGGGSGSGATCPQGGTTLKYLGGGNGTTEPASFGKTFFDNYCTGCHGPAGGFVQGQDFSTYAGIAGKLPRIDARAAAGPDNVNTSMPALDPRPSLAERQLLGTWIACGAPQN
jgi:hypothetical protein